MKKQTNVMILVLFTFLLTNLSYGSDPVVRLRDGVKKWHSSLKELYKEQGTITKEQVESLTKNDYSDGLISLFTGIAIPGLAYEGTEKLTDSEILSKTVGIGVGIISLPIDIVLGTGTYSSLRLYHYLQKSKYLNIALKEKEQADNDYEELLEEAYFISLKITSSDLKEIKNFKENLEKINIDSEKLFRNLDKDASIEEEIALMITMMKWHQEKNLELKRIITHKKLKVEEPIMCPPDAK